MNRAKVSGPDPAISARICSSRAGSPSVGSGSGGGAAPEAGLERSIRVIRRPPGGSRARRASGHRAGSGSARPAPSWSARASHGSLRSSGRRRSEAKRSSAAGQRASSAPSRWASRTRVSTSAPSPNSASRAPSAAGPSRSRIEPEERARRSLGSRRRGRRLPAATPAGRVPRPGPGPGSGHKRRGNGARRPLRLGWWRGRKRHVSARIRHAARACHARLCRR